MKKEHVYNNFFDPEIWEKVNNDNKELIEDYLLELKQNKKADGTISQYKGDLKILAMYVYKSLENKSFLEINKREFRNFSLYLTTDCHLSSSRHNRLFSSLRSLLTFAENEDDYEYDINTSKKVKGLGKEPVRDIIFLTDEQIQKLKNELINRKEFQKACILMLAYESAARKGELAGVTKDSFLDDSKNNTNQVVGKRRKRFNLLYFGGTKECAKLWLDQRGEDSVDAMWIVGNGENRHEASPEVIYDWFMYMRKLLSDMEGKEIDLNVHSLRHTSLTNYGNNTHSVLRELGLKEGFPIGKLKLLAHHESVETTQGYLPDTSDSELENMFSIKIDK